MVLTPFFPKQLLGCFFFFLQSILVAQPSPSGWQAIQNSDFTEAKRAFTAQLQIDSTDAEARIGLIFLAETLQDYEAYKKQITRLLDHHWEPLHAAVFGHMYGDEMAPGLVWESSLPIELRVRHGWSYADSLYENQRVAESRAILDQVTHPFRWYVLGPFENISGSGHQAIYSPEIQPFNHADTFYNHLDQPIYWVPEYLPRASGVIVPTDYLNDNGSGTYYAVSHFECTQPQTLQIRLQRNSPLKLWLDGDLLFEADYNVRAPIDYERLSIDIPAGRHQLQLKMSYLPEGERESNALNLYFHDQGERKPSYQLHSFRPDYSGGSFFRDQDPKALIRLTDSVGRLSDALSFPQKAMVQARTYQPRITLSPYRIHLTQRIQQAPEKWSTYYLLAKYLLSLGLVEEGEKRFFEVHQQNTGSAFFSYLLAKFYAANFKADRAEKLLNALDPAKVPLMTIMAADLEKLDPEKDEAAYLDQLLTMHQLVPTHWNVIVDIINFYKEKGREEEKKQFVQTLLQQYPNKAYQKVLEKELEDESYKPDSYKRTTDEEREAEIQKTKERLKTKWKPDDYQALIQHFAGLKQYEETFQYIDAYLEKYPRKIEPLVQKARIYFELDSLEQARQLVEEILLPRFPFDPEYRELLGDIYFEWDQQRKALNAYQSALDLLENHRYHYQGEDLMQKIRRIEEPETLTAFFDTPTFESARRDTLWKAKEIFTQAESVMLQYNIEASIEEGSTWMQYRSRAAIEILSEAGAKYWTEADLQFMGTLDFIQVHKADGSKSTPNRDWSFAVFNNLQAGDVIELAGSGKQNLAHQLPGEIFQLIALPIDVPMYKMAFQYVLPRKDTIQYICNRLPCDPVKTILNDRYVKYDFRATSLPKVEQEVAIPNNLDAFPYIGMCNTPSWSDIAEWYVDKTYQRLQPNYEIRNTLSAITHDAMSKEQQVEAIYNYITREINYSHVSFLNFNYLPKKPGTTIAAGVGDCKDVASLMISMLREVGIDAWYVLVHTRNFMHQEPLPTEASFNHAIVGYDLGDGALRFLDLTTDYFPYTVIPDFDCGAWALLAREGESAVFRLPNDALDRDKTNWSIYTRATLQDRSLLMETQAVAKGVAAGIMRETLNRSTSRDDREKALLDYFGSSGFDYLNIEQARFDQLDELNTPLTMHLDLKAYNHMERVSDFFIVQIPLLNGITTQPALFSKKRYNHLDLAQLFDVSAQTQIIDFVVPTGYKLMKLPKPIRIDNPYGTYELTFEKRKGKVRISRQLVFKTDYVDAIYYDTFKQFYVKLLDADRTKIALKRK